MAELGETSNPKELVPGNADSIEENARVSRTRSEQAQRAGEGLLAIDAGSWTGAAASAFREKFSYEPARWFSAADALESAASVLEDYATMLRWAQSRAREAVAVWERGDEHKDEAGDVLASARSSLSIASEAAAQALSERAKSAPETSSWLDDFEDLLLHVAAVVVNGAASFGNSVLRHPLDAGAVVAGLGLAAVSAAGFGGGTVLDATGIGAVVGVPAQAISAAGITAGLGIAAVGAKNVIDGAIGDDHVEVIDDSDDAAPAVDLTGRPLGREELSPDQAANLKRYEQKLPAAAEETVITRRNDGSIQFESTVPGRVPGSSATYTKVVLEDGTTAGYSKTTNLPDGSIAHVKDKMPK
ncbi:putative T7SS-secreted protein [Smaragdicoccus niigatensis]|uniref:putative T7SS-secreted protein n=1 Tax=Smaragdicoccus niigatensis TaxID=359359 RepID=UPI00036E1593|nr:hypothetical protein [Smaragdicoccus niigatensis]